MSHKQRLELTWIGKEKRPRLEPRILIEDTSLSHHAAARVSDADEFDNRLIFGDNLLALKALEHEYAGKVKCVFIDPPYNTGSAFAHYDDGIEHSLWLSLIRDRLEIVRQLLADDGSLWITIDDNEAHYLKVLCDEIFGRSNFIANVVWQKRTSPDIRATIGAGHDHILVFAKQIDAFKKIVNKIPKSDAQIKSYKNPDKDPRGPWASSDFTAQGFRPNQMYKIVTPGGAEYTPPAGTCWKNVEPAYLKLVEEGRMWFGKDGKGMPRRKTYLSESEGQTVWTWWPNSEVGHNQEAKKEIIALFGAENAFDTPKPERLLKRILDIATNPGDLVLDSFAGSGTTGAVAHKMGRKWIMVELGEHCQTHIVPRMNKVIDGLDDGGVTEATGWKGGGGYRYCKLSNSLLEKDRFGNWVIAQGYNAAMLAEAVCKLMGFTYEPSQEPEQYWRHGYSTETDFIYITTQALTHDALKIISEEVGKERTLLICCKAFNANESAFPNLTLRKIPKAVLTKCEWGRDDYSLAISSLPLADSDDEADAPKRRGRKAKGASEPSLFDTAEEE